MSNLQMTQRIYNISLYSITFILYLMFINQFFLGFIIIISSIYRHNLNLNKLMKSISAFKRISLTSCLLSRFYSSILIISIYSFLRNDFFTTSTFSLKIKNNFILYNFDMYFFRYRRLCLIGKIF